MATKKKTKEETPVTAPTRFKGTSLTAVDAAVRCTAIAVAKAGLYAVGAPLEIVGATVSDVGSGVELVGAKAKRTACRLSFKKSIAAAEAAEERRKANTSARRAKQDAIRHARAAAKQNDNLGLVEPELV